MIVAAATVVSVGLTGATSAGADPVNPPATTDIVGVGADTPLFDQLAADYNAANPTGPQLATWDSVNPNTGAIVDTIQTKGTSADDPACSIARPPSSGEGIIALEISGTTHDDHPCVDFATSSRQPELTDPNKSAFVAVARDALTWASPAGTATDPSPVPASLTPVQLANIYDCADTQWNDPDIGGTSSDTIIPVLPNVLSGDRATFLMALGQAEGLPLGEELTPGSCVVNGTDSAGDLISDDTGVTTANQQVFGTADAPSVDALYPYSVAAYIGQTGDDHATSVWAPGPLVLHQINGVDPITGSGTSEVINPNYPKTMLRTISDVLPNAGTASAPAIPTSLQGVFASSGFLCGATAQADLVSYGYTPLGIFCGGVSDEETTFGG